MKRLLIVRHGNTFLPDEPPRRIGARTDLPLTPRGEEQAREVAAWLRKRDLRPDVALAGPLQRAATTARIILAALPHPCPVGEAGWLDEVDYGPDEGRPEHEVIERIGADALARWDRSGEPAPGWPIDRAIKAAECRAGVATLPTGTTLLVTSNGTARFILLALGLGEEASTLKLRTGALGEVEVADQGARLVRWDIRPGSRTSQPLRSACLPTSGRARLLS
jgi:probable phosphoglycerate mutase